MAGAPQRDSDFRRDLLTDALRGIAFLFVYAYFWLWSLKKDKSKYLKYSALSLVSLSSLSLVTELSAEMAGPQRLEALIRKASEHKVPTMLLLGLLVVAVIYLIAYHYHEARKPEYEADFAMRLCECMESSTILGTKDPQKHVKRALELIYFVFRKAGAKHACLHTIEGDTLIIGPENVFPPENDQDYFIKLKLGEGVAGRVLSDGQIRYVPRLKILRWVFPHAVNFDYRPRTEPATGQPRYEFVESKTDYYTFGAGDKLSRRFKSFLCVPVRRSGSEDVHAILSVDFGRHDPIDKVDIVMAAVFGMTLADKFVGHTETE